MRSKLRFFSLPMLAAAAVWAGAIPSADAQGIIWQNVTDWANGTTNKTETATNGNNVNFSFGNSLTGDTVSHYYANTPLVGAYGTTSPNTLYPDGGTGTKSLLVAANFAPTTTAPIVQGNQQGITLTITLTQPTTNVSFTLFDIDASFVTNNNYVDQVRNILASSDGTNYTIQPTISAGTNGFNTVYTQAANGGTYTSDNGGTIVNAITGTASAAQNDGTPNRAITFTSVTPIKSFEFTYGDNTVAALGSVAPADPTVQIIGISNVTIPEPGSAALMVACGGVLGASAYGARHRTNRNRR